VGVRTLMFIFLIFFFGCKFVVAQDELLNQANALIYSEPDKSIEIAKKIYAESGNDTRIKMAALIVSGTAYSEKFDVEKSIENLQQALEIAEKEKDYINQIRILSLLGYQYQILEINEKTHYYLDRAEAIMEKYPLPDSLIYLRGNNYSIKALAYEKSLDCGFAIEYLNKSINIYKKLKESEIGQTNLCIAYLNKADCFLKNNNLDSARVALNKISQSTEKFNMADDILVSQNISLGKYYYLKKDYNQSIKYLKTALGIAEKLAQIDIDLEIYQLLSENYLAINDIEKYEYYSGLYSEARSNVSEAEKRSITYIINEPPEAIKRKMVKKSGIYIYIGSFLLLVILILTIVMVVKSRRLKQKMKNFDSGEKF